MEVTDGIAGGVVMKTGCPALEELTIARKHAKITNPKAESNLRRKKARMRRLNHGSRPRLVNRFIRDFIMSDKTTRPRWRNL